MDPLQAFVATYAPVLIGAGLDGAGGTSPDDDRRLDREVARLLADLWVAGPPFAPAVERAWRRLTAGGGDLVDLGREPVPVPERVPVLDPVRLAGLVAAVRRRTDHRSRAAQSQRVLQGVAAAAAAVLLGVGAVHGVGSIGRRDAVAPVGQGGPGGGVIGSPAPSTPVPSCAYVVCDWTVIEDWSVGVKAAVYARLDPGGELLGVLRNGPMSTTVTHVPGGRLVEAGFGSAVTRTPYGFGVWVTATSRYDLAPVCGHRTGRACQGRLDRDRHRVEVSSSPSVIEVLRQVAPQSWVYVRIESPGSPLPVGVDHALRLADDERLGLPG